MEKYTAITDSLILIIILGSAILLILLLREFLIHSNIKKKSELFKELMILNNKYNSTFQVIQKNHKVNYICNSLQQYKNNCNKISIVNYVCGIVRENEIEWQGLYSKVNSNKRNYNEYLKAYEIIKNEKSGKNFENIKKAAFWFSEKQYLKFEEKYCKKRLLNPIITLCINIKISYTSPAGRNRYSSGIMLTNEEIDEIFTRIEDRRFSEQSIDYQRALMTSGKRYDILRRDKYQCQICGRSQSDGAKLEVDHIIPVSKGGKTVDENLQTLCRECNQGKRAKI